MKLIYLEWEDATSQNGWHTKEEVEQWIKDDNVLIRQVGWIIEENKKYLILVSRLGKSIFEGEEDPSYGLIQKIPKTWIRKRKDLTKDIK